LHVFAQPITSTIFKYSTNRNALFQPFKSMHFAQLNAVPFSTIQIQGFQPITVIFSTIRIQILLSQSQFFSSSQMQAFAQPIIMSFSTIPL